MAPSRFVPGLTVRSLAIGWLAVMLMAMHIQYVEVILADSSAVGEHALPLSAMAVFLGVLLVATGLGALTRRAWLDRGELFCVLVILLMAAPIMSQGMWHRFLGLLAATPRGEHFDYLDALPDKLWPHGPNLAAPRFAAARPRGGAVTWEEAAVTAQRTLPVAVLRHERADAVSGLDIVVPVAADGRPGLAPGEPHLVSVLARGENFSSESRVFIRVYQPDGAYTELASAAEEQRVTFLQPHGFLRVGAYGVTVPVAAGATEVTITIGLSGPGTVRLADPKLFSVAALEWAYSGRAEIHATEAARLSATESAGTIVRPARWWSLPGLRYVLTGYIPVGAWVTPAVAWSGLVFLLLAATFAIAVLLRRLWAENQRYPFPTFQIPALLVGATDEPGALWRRRALWIGFALALAWCLLRGWHFYNPRVPDLNFNVALGQYLSDPGWGGMWNVQFSVSAIFLSLCLFMELNVLLSVVVGFFAFRVLWWLGATMGWDAQSGYPFAHEQTVGAYLGYALVVVLLTHRYWRELAGAIRRNQWPGGGTEALRPRVAAAVLLGSFVGAYGWAHWLEVSPTGLVCFFAFLVTVGFVAAKLRAECGLPWGYFTPYNAMLVMGLLGGMIAFGPAAMLVCLIASGFLSVTVFFFIPGLQVELVEFGRRLRIQPRHLAWTAVLGAMAGLVAGGWVFLSNAYALGGQSIKYQWAFQQDWFFSSYRQEFARATASILGEAEAAAASGWRPSHSAYLYGGVGAAALAVIRQLAPGFWFHPIGFILGSTHFVSAIWGSALVACAIKWVGLKLGGAAFYRQTLVPLAVGIFLGAVASVLFFNIHSTLLRRSGVEHTYGAMP